MPNPIDWVPVDSTVLQLAAYSAQRRWLYLKFKSGEIYRYFDFPPEQYRDFLAAESKGTYFGKYIRANNSDTNTFLDLATPTDNYRGLLRTLTKLL